MEAHLPDVSAGYRWVLQRGGEASTSSRDPEPSSSYREAERFNSTGRATAPELERLHDALQQKEEQLALYQQNISQLEATRDRQASCLAVTEEEDMQRLL